LQGVGEDGAPGLQASRQYPRLRMGSSCRVRESGLQEGKTGRGSGAGRPAPLPLPMLPPVRAHFGPRDSGGLESSEAGTGSAGLVKVGNLLIIFDGSPGGSRRRTPESVLAFVAPVPDALELVEVVLDQAIQRRSLGIARPVDSLGQALHTGSNCLVTLAAKKMQSGTKRCTRGNFLAGKAARGSAENQDNHTNQILIQAILEKYGCAPEIKTPKGLVT